MAVLGGNATDKTSFLLGLALRHIRQSGSVLCFDARRHKQTEVQFRLLLRQRARYTQLPASGEVSPELAQTALSVVGQSLASRTDPPPLLLLDSVHESPDWERTVVFLLNAGATVVETLHAPAALIFGRYDTVLLLHEKAEAADALSRAVGRKITAEALTQLKTGEGILIHLAQVYRVVLPNPFAGGT